MIFRKFFVVIRKLYWFIFRPETKGVKVIVECGGDWLLIKNSYGKKLWTFPGGAVEKREMPEDSAKREVCEEIGIEVSGIREIGRFLNTAEYKKDTVYCYVAVAIEKDIVKDRGEIKEAKWFHRRSLPSEMSPIAQKISKFYQ